MRVICTICTELFDGTSDVSVVPCGHLFHGACLGRWTAQSMTCPQCRSRITNKSIIHKLFLNQADVLDSSSVEPDVCHLENELEGARLALGQKDHEKKSLIAEKRELEGKLCEMKENLKTMESLHQQELVNNKTLKRELSDCQRTRQELSTAREESSTLREKLKSLHNVQAVINGCDREIEEMVVGTTDMSQLATWCCVYKRELDRKRADFRDLSGECQRKKKDAEVLRCQLGERSAELASCRERIKCLEEDVASQDQQIISLQKKISLLEAAVASPSNPSASLARRFLHESPAPALRESPAPAVVQETKRPKLSGVAQTIDLNDSCADLFASPAAPPSRNCASDQSSRHSSKTGSSENLHPRQNPMKSVKLKELKLVTTSSSSSSLDSHANRDSRLTNQKLEHLNLNILKKRPVGGSMAGMSSVFKRGYNGLGGHETFISPLRRPALKPFAGPRRTSHQPKLSSLVSNNMPPLPSLNVDDLH